MKDRKVVLELHTGHINQGKYRVTKTINTIEPKVDEMLSAEDVEKLIRRARTTVEIKAK
jgi:hypothetical protein